MAFKIPFTLSNTEKLKKKSKFFISKLKYKKKSSLGDNLEGIGTNLSREEYLGIILRNLFFNFIFLMLVSSTILFFLKAENFIIYSIGVSLLFSFFIAFIQRAYPSIFISRKQREIEKNLLTALEDISIQLNSGIPLFNIMVNISGGDYGVLSQEFKKAVKKINAGEPEADVLNYLGKINPSNYFRRTLWQISNGINSGSDMSIVIRESIKSLNEEQMVQIQNYGSKLNPLIVMYMLMGVIIPSLSVTFLTILSSMINLEKTMVMLLFFGVLIGDLFFQIMFLGMIKSRRPSLF